MLWMNQTTKRPAYRIFCLPYAGGGASIYRLWPQKFLADIVAVPIQLPGRENRILEPLFTDFDSLIDQIYREIKPYLDRPFAFFGHSMGSLISFELARTIRREQHVEPAHLFVSGRRAPQIPSNHAPLASLPADEFMAEVRALGGTPEAVLQNHELMEILLPIIRADFALYEQYVYQPDEPFSCPISAFGGFDDTTVARADLDAWSQHTRAQLIVKMFPGDHFFLHAQQDHLINLIQHALFSSFNMYL